MSFKTTQKIINEIFYSLFYYCANVHRTKYYVLLLIPTDLCFYYYLGIHGRLVKNKKLINRKDFFYKVLEIPMYIVYKVKITNLLKYFEHYCAFYYF